MFQGNPLADMSVFNRMMNPAQNGGGKRTRLDEVSFVARCRYLGVSQGVQLRSGSFNRWLGIVFASGGNHSSEHVRSRSRKHCALLAHSHGRMRRMVRDWSMWGMR
jgi:hypothetical protein